MIRHSKNIKDSSRAQFFSLTIFLLLVISIIFFTIRASLYDKEDNFNIDRLQITVMNNYVTDFDQKYLEQIIWTSLKPAIAGVLNRSEDTSKIGLIAIMNGSRTGYMDPSLSMPSTLHRVLGTTIFSLNNPDNIMNVTLKKVEQTRPDMLKFTFEAGYRFEFHDSVWEEKGREIIIFMDIHSLKHPAYDYQYIENDWIIDPGPLACFSNQVFTDAEPCTNLNMRPALDIDYEG